MKEHTEEELRWAFAKFVTIGLGVVIFVIGVVVGYIARV